MAKKNILMGYVFFAIECLFIKLSNVYGASICTKAVVECVTTRDHVEMGTEHFVSISMHMYEV